MAKYFATSDLHFWHTNVIKYENRPWKTVEEMNEALIKNWNDTVRPEDKVFILGDVSLSGWRMIKPIIQRLNGHKILVRGNHDTRWLKDPDSRNYFDEIYDYKELQYHGHIFVMSHYPIACWHGMEHGSIHLYGHIHSRMDNLPEDFNRSQSYNVGIDVNHYKPVELDWIIDIKEKAKNPELYIPKDTPYCCGCPFWDYAENRGEQNCGVCHYLNTSDYEQNQMNNNNDAGSWSHSDKSTTDLYWEQFPHSLLWDECKECSINE